MAQTVQQRSLRDGSLVVADNGSASVTVTLDEGDLSWTVTRNTREVMDRDNLDHTRPGPQSSCPLSYSFKWLNLVDGTLSTNAGSAVLYELLLNKDSSYSSTSSAGEQFTLKHTFTVADPAGGSNGEVITFNKVYTNSVNPREGDLNTIAFDGTDFETEPAITRA